MGDPAEIQTVDAETVAQLPARRPEKAPIRAGAPLDAIIPRDLDEAWRLTDAIVKAGMVPNSYEGKDASATRAALMIGVMKGLEVGLPPITALSTIMIVNNRPSIWGDGAVALVQSKGQVEKVEQTFTGKEGADDWTAHYRIWRRGQAEPYEGKFSVADAKRAHLWGNVKKPIWSMYPQRMLMARARAYALRDGFADCLAGLAITEEMQDIPAPPEKVETSFLDDSIPEPAPPTIEHKPEVPTAPANDSVAGEPAAVVAPPIEPAKQSSADDWDTFAADITRDILSAASVEGVQALLDDHKQTLRALKSARPTLQADILECANKRMRALGK